MAPALSGAGAECGLQVGEARVHGHEHQLHFWQVFSDFAGGINAIQQRHSDIRDDEVGFQS